MVDIGLVAADIRIVSATPSAYIDPLQPYQSTDVSKERVKSIQRRWNNIVFSYDKILMKNILGYGWGIGWQTIMRVDFQRMYAIYLYHIC